MNTEKLGQEPAFACMYGTSENGYLQEGMSKRFYAACMVLQGLLSNPNTAEQIISHAGIVNAETANAIVCETAYEIADELLKQENK